MGKQDTFLDLHHSLFLEGTNFLAGKGKFFSGLSCKAICLVAELHLNFNFQVQKCNSAEFLGYKTQSKQSNSLWYALVCMVTMHDAKMAVYFRLRLNFVFWELSKLKCLWYLVGLQSSSCNTSIDFREEIW